MLYITYMFIRDVFWGWVMEYRKLISFGKNSYVVSLPKNWVRQNKLKKGDLVYIEENVSNLVLQPRPSESGEEKEITIQIDGKSKKRIQREIISAYIQNYKTIKFVGNDVKEKAMDIQGFVQNLVALEIIEQDSKRVTTKDFLNLNDISIDQILRKMDAITRSMLKDCREMFDEDKSENIYHRDNDVNKFRFLIFRIIWFGMESPSVVLKKLNLRQHDLFNYWWLSFSIESIADYIKRIARLMKETKLPAKEREEFTNLLAQIEIMYEEIMKAYYTKNLEIAHKVVEERFEIIKRCDDFYKKNRDVSLIGYLVYNTKSLIVSIHSIGRIVYQGIPG